MRSTRRLASRRRYAGRVGALSAAELVEATAEFERIKELTFRIWLFAKLSADTDTADAEAARALQRAVERQTAIESELLFFSLESLALDDARALSLVEDPLLDRYSHFLRSAAPIPSIRPVGGGGARRGGEVARRRQGVGAAEHERARPDSCPDRRR